MTDHACQDTWRPDGPGGWSVSHPRKPGTLEEIRDLGGLGFEAISARPTPPALLSLYTPQPRNRLSMRGFLNEAAYIIRAADVVKKKRVIPADEMRERLGLNPTQRLILLLFDRDELLEQMWARSGELIWQIEEAHYDMVVSPSFSTYTPRPRTEFMINAKRSMLYFKALQDAGAPAVPRIAWNVTWDVRRFAAWTLMNPSVDFVALDWSTYRIPRGFRDQVEGLKLFDALTHRRLTYLINGLTTEDRCLAVLQAVPAPRVRITNATTQARIPLPAIRPKGDQTGRTFKDRRDARFRVIESAAAKADDLETQPTLGLERSIDRQAA